MAAWSQTLRLKSAITQVPGAKADDPIDTMFVVNATRELGMVYRALRDEEWAGLVTDLGVLRTVGDADGWLKDFYDWADMKHIEVL